MGFIFGWFAGSVAAMMALVKDHSRPVGSQISAVLAHVGDCRAVVSDLGVAVQVTEDHKPSLPKEKERIEV